MYFCACLYAKENINKRGYNKFLQISNNIKVCIDYDKIEQDGQWDGLKGDITKTITTIKINLSVSGNTMTKTMILTVKHRSIAKLFDEKSKCPTIRLTELAYQCGYYDQAHMINDFRKLSGLSPKQYFENCEPFSDYFQPSS